MILTLCSLYLNLLKFPARRKEINFWFENILTIQNKIFTEMYFGLLHIHVWLQISNVVAFGNNT